MILTEESFLAYSAFIRFYTSMAHLMPAHVCSIGELHITNITFKKLTVAIVVVIVVDVKWIIVVDHA